MAGTNILPGKVLRILPFQSWTETRNTHKRLSEFALQKKARCGPRLVTSNFNQQEDNVNDGQDDNVNDSKHAIHFNESYDRASGEIGFEAIAAIGRVECTGLGCRPVFPDNVLSAAMFHDGWLPYEHAMEALNARIQSYNGMKMNPRGHFHGDFARYLYRVWMQKALAEKYYEQALEIEPRNPQLLVEYAEYVWNLMGDEEKAEKLFNVALQEDPNDPIIRGSYALFMCQREST